MTEGLFRFVQPGSKIQVSSGISAVLGNATAALSKFSRAFLLHFGIGEAMTAFVHRAKIKLIAFSSNNCSRPAAPEALHLMRRLPLMLFETSRLA